MPPIINIKLDDSGCDGRKPVLVCRDNAVPYPDIDKNREQQFLDLVAQLNLVNPKGIYALVHHIKYCQLIDDDEMANWVKPNECDWEMLSLMEMLLASSGWKDVENVRIGYKFKDGGKTKSVNLANHKFYEDMTQSVLKTYLKKFAPRYIVKEYFEKKYKWDDIIRHEVDRLRKLKKFWTERTKHRPSTNKRNYCILLLFFDILEVSPNKENCNLMIRLLQFMNLWKEELLVHENSYKLILRQWSTAQMYKLLFLEKDFPEKTLLEGIEGLNLK